MEDYFLKLSGFSGTSTRHTVTLKIGVHVLSERCFVSVGYSVALLKHYNMLMRVV
jgi:hypothetical protein